MAIWSYACRSCDGKAKIWHVSLHRVQEMPESTRFVRVKVEGEWRCAVLMRESAVEIDAELLRDVVPSTPEDCPDCAGIAVAELKRTTATRDAAGSSQPAAQVEAPDEERTEASRTVNAAAISLQDVRFVVVLVHLDLVRSPGEADMAIEALSPSFGGVPVVLMAQDDDGSPHFYGDGELLRMLADVPIEQMPWTEHVLR